MEQKSKHSARDLFFSFLRLGLTAFGGPAIIAYIRELSVEKKGWLSSDEFADGISLCQTIPGATAMQVSAYIGLKARGILGALSSFIGFGSPSFFFILGLTILYAKSRSLPAFSSLFAGLKVVVVALVANAFFSLLRSYLKERRDIIPAVFAFLLFFFGINPFLTIILSGIMGIIIYQGKNRKESPHFTPHRLPKVKGGLKPGFILTFLFLLGISLLFLIDEELASLSLIMAKIDLFAMGGGYTSVPLMLNEVVGKKRLLDGATFMDGIALGQVTPGPIVITATFVGYLLYGLAGALVGTVSVFSPSFIILITIAPYFERLKRSLLFRRMMRGVLASFIGLLLFAVVKFASFIPWDIPRVILLSGALVALLLKVDILLVVVLGTAVSFFILNP
ncbi:MAG: chromate efflux transporter [Acidobacteria bacterium]|nr:chromate efflux transporter [Acidobacteriota bacterium]